MSLKSTRTREWPAEWNPGSGCRGEGPWVSVLRSLSSEMLAHLWSSEPAAASPSAVAPDVLGETSEHFGGQRSQPGCLSLGRWGCRAGCVPGGALRLLPWELILLSAPPLAWAPFTHPTGLGLWAPPWSHGVLSGEGLTWLPDKTVLPPPLLAVFLPFLHGLDCTSPGYDFVSEFVSSSGL